MKVLLIGDGIRLTTGFSQVLNHVAGALVARGDEVAQIACLDGAPDCDSRYYWERGVQPFFPLDNIGFSILQDTLWRFAPDRIVMNVDPGMGYSWLKHLRACSNRAPIVFYTPIEGRPIHRQYCEALAADGVTTILYTEGAADEVAATCGLRCAWVPHGVDTSVWHPLTPAERAGVRAQLGWTDKFVAMYVGRNCYRKAQDVLIEAMPSVIAAEPDSRLYLHCATFDDSWGQGWDLGWMAETYGVADHVEFPQRQSALFGEAEVSLARKLAASDLYVHPALVEGLGLPLLEAMACGTPVVIPEDEWAMEEVVDTAYFAKLKTYRRPPWFTGALLSPTMPQQWADVIVAAQRMPPEELAAAGARGLARAREFTWERMTDTLLDAIDRAEFAPTAREAVASV
ncbi:MAG: glycosyltransferase family 4 protein [bacterium]